MNTCFRPLQPASVLSTCRTWAGLMILALMLLCGAPARAAYSPKIALDLQVLMALPITPNVNWARDVNGVRHVKVLIVSNSDDAELTTLRRAVMAAGGSIYYRYSSVLALSALVPANKLASLAALAEVQSISPNRLMTRSASTLETVTGTAALRTTGAVNYAQVTGVTGKGIGIAVLDSGIAWQHANFKGDGGSDSRVRESQNFTKAGDAGLDFFAKLNKAGNFVPVIGKAAPLAQGATPIIVRWDYLALADRDTLKGNPPVNVIVPKTGVLAGVYVQAISAYAPHPNAAKLWQEYLYSDEGQLGLLKGYCHPIRFQNLVDTKKIPDELMKKLPPPEAYAKATGPTIEQGNALKETITKGWDKVVGANIAK